MIIFITALSEYVYDAFEVEALDYICKPIDENRLQKALSRAVIKMKEKQIAKDMDDNILTDNTIKKMTVNTLFERYMQTKELAETTRGNYVKMWNNHAKDDIGNIKVVQLRSSHVKTFYAKMSKAGYSHSTIKLIHSLLSVKAIYIMYMFQCLRFCWKLA